MKRGRRGAWVLFIAWLLLTSTVLVIPYDIRQMPVGRGFDKVVHTALFTTLGVFAQAALPWSSALITLPLAAGLEYVQKYIPQRTFDRVDLVSNLLGAVLGALLFEVSTRLRRR